MLKTDEEFHEFDVIKIFDKVEKKYGPYFETGGHSWAEFYLPDVGWVPVDPTWGVEDEVIPSYLSRMGNNRNIPMPDYYFGKNDGMRITLYKGWNYTLDPAPVSPGAKPIQDWMVGYTERNSGVEEMLHGWEGLKSAGGGSVVYGFFRSEKYAGSNFLPTVEALGPLDQKQIASAIEAITAEGHHYLRVPPVKASWPMVTAGDGFREKFEEMVKHIEDEFPKNEEKRDLIEEKVVKHLMR